MLYKSSLAFFVFLFHFFGVFHKTKAIATEGGVSFYVPGLYGDVAIAVAPPPGAYLLSTTIYYQGEAPNSLLPLGVDEKLEAKTIAQLLRGFWVSDDTLFGARMMMGIRAAAFDIDVSSDVSTPLGSVNLQDNNKDLGDFAVMPISLFWKVGDIHLNLYEVINLPTGKFNSNRLANTSLHHWAFDTVLTATWIDPKSGIEISLAPGIIYNTKNPDTDYQSGIEFHMDAMINFYLNQELSIGIHGATYKQLTADKGAHPSLGLFKGESFAIGPSITWYSKNNQTPGYLSFKWLHEFEAKNKIEGDITMLSIGMKF